MWIMVAEPSRPGPLPLSLALAERCDAILPVGGPSSGADEEVARVAPGAPDCCT
jgi:hypothetical protein